MSRRAEHFSVHPRYTPGSGAWVGEDIGRRVAVEERESYEQTLTGIYGDEHKKRAETLGLMGIVEILREHKDGFNVEDVLTGKRLWRGRVKASKVQVGDTIIDLRTYEGTTERTLTLPVKRVTRAGKSLVVHSDTELMQFRSDEVVKIERPDRSESSL
jgi:co-chaperonin GroES (HSP10)